MNEEESGNNALPPRAALGKGLLILLVAVIVGIVILNSLDQTKSTATKTTVKKTSSNTAVSSSTTTTTIGLRSPADIKILVANGSGTSGVGKTASELLTKSKYAALPPVTAKSKSATTAIYYGEGYQKEAALIATVMNLGTVTAQPMPASLPVDDLDGANVLIVIGTDQAGSFAPQSTSTTAMTTATTAATTSTT